MEEHDIRDMLQQLGCHKIRRTHGNVLSTCPFGRNHKKGQDKNPSFTIEITPAGEESRWNCFACGERGNSIRSFAYKVRNILGIQLDIMDEGLKEYTPKLKLDPDWKPMKKRWWRAAKELEFNIDDFDSFYQTPCEYARKRGLTEEQIREWKIGFDSYRRRMFIPIFDMNQRMVGHSSRATEPDQKPKYYHAPGFQKEKYLYGEHLWDTSIEVACLSEGFFDVWNLHRAGLPNASAFFGTGVGDEQLWKLFKRFKTVILFPHNDPPALNGERPGFRMAEEWVNSLQQANVEVLVAPVIKGKSDVGDWTIEEIRYVVGKHMRQDSLFNDRP